MAPLVFVYAELGAMFPESGGPSRFDHHAFGSLAGATFGWFLRACARDMPELPTKTQSAPAIDLV